MKIMVVGHARHGKDTVGELLKSRYNLSFKSSSLVAARDIIMPKLGPKYGYATVKACYEDRANHRAEWFDLITAFNLPDRTALGRLVLSEADVYCGVRNRLELYACKNAGLYDASIFVDALDRLPPEGPDSMQIEPWMADYVLDNNNSLEELGERLADLMITVYKAKHRQDYLEDVIL